MREIQVGVPARGRLKRSFRPSVLWRNTSARGNLFLSSDTVSLFLFWLAVGGFFARRGEFSPAVRIRALLGKAAWMRHRCDSPAWTR